MGKPQLKKFWFILGALITTIVIIGGLTMFKIRTDEERRNHEYEVSLVKALKNTYAGLKEIEMSEPIYSEIPGDWTCGVKLTFEDGEEVSYRIGHSLSDFDNASAITSNDTINILRKHYGTTATKVAVTYSDDRKEVE